MVGPEQRQEAPAVDRVAGSVSIGARCSCGRRGAETKLAARARRRQGGKQLALGGLGHLATPCEAPPAGAGELHEVAAAIGAVASAHQQAVGLERVEQPHEVARVDARASPSSCCETGPVSARWLRTGNSWVRIRMAASASPTRYPAVRARRASRSTVPGAVRPFSSSGSCHVSGHIVIETNRSESIMIDAWLNERRPMENLILVPLDDSILFPGMSATIAVETGEEERVLLVPRTDGEFAGVGVIADVVERMRIPGGGSAVTVEGIARGVPGAANTDSSGTLRVEVTVHDDPSPRTSTSASCSASTARWSRRSSTCAAPTHASAHFCAPSPVRARWPTRPATRRTSASPKRSGCSRRST